MIMKTSPYHLHHHRVILDQDVGMPPYHDYYYANESTNFDNMVIILAAFLCALICALGMNSFVRCAQRYGSRFASETTPEAAAAAIAGLTKSTLKQMPVIIYEPKLNVGVTDCPICLGEFGEGEKVRVLPKCNHGFHIKCIDKWLEAHSSCPLCRRPLIDQSTSYGINIEVEQVNINVQLLENWSSRIQ